jgi:hypothetical protein
MTDTQSTFGGNDAWIVTTSPLVASKHAETPRGIAKALKFSLLPYLPGTTRGAACDLNPWFGARSQAWWSFELTLHMSPDGGPLKNNDEEKEKKE